VAFTFIRPNVKSVISCHNNRILNQPQMKTNPSQKDCNCRKPFECPLNRKCQPKSIVYKAEITSLDDGLTKQYIGMTSNPFKERYRNHKKSFNNIRYEKKTKHSKESRKCTIKWSILKSVPSYAPGQS
jgi:hypothetical protein